MNRKARPTGRKPVCTDRLPCVTSVRRVHAMSIDRIDWLLDEAFAIMRLCSASEFNEAKRRSDKLLVEFSQSLLQPQQMPPLLCNTFPCNPTHLLAQRTAANKAALLARMARKQRGLA